MRIPFPVGPLKRLAAWVVKHGQEELEKAAIAEIEKRLGSSDPEPPTAPRSQRKPR